jgi:hypothetical protein
MWRMTENQFEDNFPTPNKLSDTQPRRVKQPAADMGNTAPAATAQNIAPAEVAETVENTVAPIASPPDLPIAQTQIGRAHV